MPDSLAIDSNQAPPSLRDQVRSAVIWRSGSQILGQLVAWLATFLVIHILNPSDYGLYALCAVVLTVFSLLNGYSLANAVIQSPAVDDRLLHQLFGMLLLTNLGLAATQVAVAPLIARYYQQPMVADMLRVQAILYLTTPFIAVPYAILSRRMDFRRQAQVNLLAALVSAGTAFGGAIGGLGVWTLVLAPLAGYLTKAAGLTIAARSWLLPSFDFRGAGHVARFGGLVSIGQLFWLVQTQADVVIGGRALDVHQLGIYTTSLFLTQIFVAKVVPPLNEVAFSAYARIQHDRDSVAAAFLKSLRVILLAGLPFYVGLIVTAEPLVQVALGAQWGEAAAIVRLLSFAMPFAVLLAVVGNTCDALGKPGISVGTSIMGAVLLLLCFAIGIQWGVTGMAVAWIVAYPLLAAQAVVRSLPTLGVRASDLLGAIMPQLLAATAMGLIVVTVDQMLPTLPPLARLTVLAVIGAAVYGLWLMLFARTVVEDCLALLRR